MSDINWEEYRDWCLASPTSSYRLLGSNKKVQMQDGKGYETFCLHLSPHKESVRYGGVNMCQYAVPACIQGCIAKTGHHQMKHAKKRRIERTLWYNNDCENFDRRLRVEIEHAIARVRRKELTLALRLDGVSDIGLGRYYKDMFPQVMFYDYTKDFSRMANWMGERAKGRCSNYHLTFSWSGQNDVECYQILENGGNVAIPVTNASICVMPTAKFGKLWLPSMWGYRYVDGTDDDRRFLDPDIKGTIIGLKWKGSKKRMKYALADSFCIDTSVYWSLIDPPWKCKYYQDLTKETV